MKINGKCVDRQKLCSFVTIYRFNRKTENETNEKCVAGKLCSNRKTNDAWKTK